MAYSYYNQYEYTKKTPHHHDAAQLHILVLLTRNTNYAKVRNII